MNKYRKKTIQPLAPQKEEKGPQKPPKERVWPKFVLPILYLTAILLPIVTFFKSRSGLQAFDGLKTSEYAIVLFPLLGLIAFSLVTWQVLLATNIWWLKNYWPKILHLHRWQGILALVFATLHPLFILAGYGATVYFGFDYIAPARLKYLIPAYLALCFIFATVITALLVWHGKKLPFWRQVHLLNYLIFPFVWIHSWSVGTDTRTGNLKTLWLAYLLVVAISVSVNWWYKAYRAPIYANKDHNFS